MGSGELYSQNRSRRIARLPENLVNQIAAGEVVERPASVIKECVENSLDAGASRIEVWLTDGGMSEISILDNGEGIIPEDMPLAIERHATSKIRDAADLEAIGTYGFRGEALSSIASVAEMEIRSRTKESPSGFSLHLDFGQPLESLRPIGHPVGTAIHVRKLFEKIPARKKYLKSLTTELSHCSRLVRELALGAPGVSFFLHHQGNLLHRYTAATRLTRFHEVFRCPWDPLVVEAEADDMRLEAFLSPPDVSLGRGELFLFINHRAVRNRTLLAAVRGCYSDLLGPGREPSGVVFLDLRRDWVDVNVHPQKLEVRCLRQEALYPWIVGSVRRALAAVASPIPSVPPAFSAADPATRWEAAGLRYLGQTGNYLLCEAKEGLLLIDPHALQELTLRETLRLPLLSKVLPIPRMVRFSRKDVEVIASFRQTFDTLGFDLEVFGDGEVAVKASPEILPEAAIETVLQELIKRPGEPDLAPILCRSVIPEGSRVTPGEAIQLLESYSPKLDELLSPHGRPWRYFLSFEAVEKHFQKGTT